jgi:hypothetical protein
MGISEVKSPASSGSRTRTGFGPGSNQPMSPGSRSVPRSDQAGEPSPKPTQPHISLGGGDEPAEMRIAGPEGREDRRRESTPTGEPREHETATDRVEHGGG